MKYFKEEILNCYAYCPFNDHGIDVATGYQFIPCSSHHRENCDIAKEGDGNKCSTNTKDL